MATLRTAVSTIQPLMSMRPSIPKKTLTQSLTLPSTVAHLFDWKKHSSNHILTLQITKEAIECAVASHPTTATNPNYPIMPLPPIPLTRDIPRDVTMKHVTGSPTTATGSNIPPASFHVASVTKALQEVIQTHNVCGMVVVYPTNTENGCKNVACGRVLHILDHVSLSGSRKSDGTTTKPICLYDPNAHHHHSENVVPDEWGRSPLYSTITTAKVVHCAKQPQSGTNGNTLQQAWCNFVHQYWPDVGTTTPEYDFNDYDDDDDLSEFITKLNKNNNHYRAPIFHMNGGNSHNMEHKAKDLVYQSA